MSILARRLLRETAKATLEAITGITVDSPGDWEVTPARLPNLKLRSPMDRKLSTAKSMPTFTTTVTLEILGTIEAPTDVEAQDALDELGSRIEDAFFSAQPIVRLCQQFPAVTTETDISADGKRHVGRIKMSIDCEVFEAFEPTEINPLNYPALQQMNVHVDTAQPFDASGTYASPPFPASVKPAPRTSGPDGRDEGTLQIDLT